MRKFSGVILLGVMFCSRLGQTQDIDRARQLFEEASNLRAAGQYADAVVRLRDAIAIKDTPGLEYHAGFCEAKLGHYRLALKYYDRAAVLLRQGATAPDVVSLLLAAHAAALEHVAKLRIYISPMNAFPRMRLDQEPEQTVPGGDLVVDAGPHQLAFTAPGYASERREVSVNEAEVLSINVTFTPNASQPHPQQVEERRPFPWKTVTIGLGFGVTAAGLAVGITSAVNRRDAQKRVHFFNSFTPKSDTEIAKAEHDETTATRWETIGFVAAGIGAAASASLWALWPSSRAVSVSVTPPSSRSGPIGLIVGTKF